MTDAQYRKQFNRLHTLSAKAGSKEECDRIDAALVRLNARRKAGA